MRKIALVLAIAAVGEALIALLARVLTPEQLQIIEEQHNVQLQMQRVQAQLMRAQQETVIMGRDASATPASN